MFVYILPIFSQVLWDCFVKTCAHTLLSPISHIQKKGGTSTPAQLGFTNLRYTNPYVPISYVPSSSVPNLIFTILQKWSHAVGKARPHGRPGRRGAVRREGLRPSLLSLHFSIASGPLVNSRCGTDELGTDELR